MERNYTPGVCNLSDAEARMRNTAGWIGLVLTLALEVYFVYAQVPPTVRLIIFIPATFGAIGFLQGLMHFCVSFGMKGVFNMTNEVGKTESVSQAQFRAQDKTKATQILAYSAAIGAVVAALAFLF